MVIITPEKWGASIGSATVIQDFVCDPALNHADGSCDDPGGADDPELAQARSEAAAVGAERRYGGLAGLELLIG